MINRRILFILLSLYTCIIYSQNNSIAILWKDGNLNGSIKVLNGTLKKIEIIKGKGSANGNKFSLTAQGEKRIEVFLNDVNIEYGPNPTLLTVENDKNTFSFFLRDISSISPIYIPQYNVIIVPSEDERMYSDIELDILSRKNKSKIQRINGLPEMSFEVASKMTRNMPAPIWLGLGRDMRLFEISEESEDNYQEDKIITPRFSSSLLKLPQFHGGTVSYKYSLGRGIGVMNNIERRLENNCLPIYHSILTDDDIVYHTISFVALEDSILSSSNINGTSYWLSDSHSRGRRFTKEQKQKLDSVILSSNQPREKTILCSQTIIENTSEVSRYAWIKNPRPGGWGIKYKYDSDTGISCFDNDSVFCISRLNGVPLRNEEIAILLLPHQKVTFEFYLPHSPISYKRALALVNHSFNRKYESCKLYWLNKLNESARITVPEKRINDMIKAGLLHLDLITYGEEPNGALATNVGVYSPIGTESAPIIQYYMSMGLNDIAKRSLRYFLETQQNSGLIQNYFGYWVETGAVLWLIGEYYKYTKDKEWIEEIKNSLLKACDYHIAWRNKSKKKELKGRGYGMIDGKVADPEDHYHQFMLNGYGYLGLKSIAEVLLAINDSSAKRIMEEAEAWKKDIRESLFYTMGHSPVVPLGDGTWCPTVPPWAEGQAPRLLYFTSDRYWSHGTFTVPDGLLGAFYLIFCNVLDPKEQASQFIYNYFTEILCQSNSLFSQPYYGRHNWYQINQGMVKPFLNTYYMTMSAIADRYTYTFWEHLHRQSVHKTHEEAGFLMDTRWMLYMEKNDSLLLFNTIPREWLEDGKKIELNGVQSYFGKLYVLAESFVNDGFIEAKIKCNSSELKKICIRLPHPLGKKPVKITGGCYDEDTETIIIDKIANEIVVRIEF